MSSSDNKVPALYILLLMLQGVSPNSLSAQAGEASPPVLMGFVEADYPEGAARDGLSAVVELSLTTDVIGHVVEAEVVDEQGHGFDEAALAAVVQFRFSPATREGEPIAVRIRYRYRFEQLEQVEDLEPATLADAAADGRSTDQAPLRIAPASEAPVRSRGRASSEPTYGAVAEVDALETDVLTRSVEGPMLTRIPGTRGDPLRAVEILPGVGRPSFIAGGLLVRGAGLATPRRSSKACRFPSRFTLAG